jgi:hypothetical protein
MRPPEVTDEDVARWQVEANNLALLTGRPRELLLDMVLAGEWLGGQVRSSGGTGMDARCASMCYGQRATYIETVEGMWDLARTCLERFKAGDVDEPGEVLAEKLFNEQGVPPGNRESLIARLKCMRVDSSNESEEESGIDRSRN